MGMVDVSTLPAPSDLPGRPGEQLALHRYLKAHGVRIDELGTLLEAQADKIRWLEAEVARVGSGVQELRDDVHRERHYRQTGTLPPLTGNSTADWERRAKSRKPGWEPTAETAYDGGPVWSHQTPIAVEGQNGRVEARGPVYRVILDCQRERGTAR